MAGTDGVMLTPKNLYRLMTGRLRPYTGVMMLPSGRRHSTTLTKFWWNFLSNLVPGPVLDPMFEVGEHRPRALSNIMNRTVKPSLPQKLGHALDSGLQADSFFGLVRWVMKEQDATQDPVVMHHLLTRFEDACREQDVLFEQQYAFFVTLRPQIREDRARHMERLFFRAALRLTWLGLYAVYGTEMDSLSLRKYRRDLAFSEEVLWRRVAYSTGGAAEAEEAMPPPSASDAEVEALAQALWSAEANQSADARAGLLVSTVNRLASPAVSELPAEYAGWYAVANWTDVCIALNNTPGATYDGARLLDTIPNGALIYIIGATGYGGLHNSPRCWGCTEWRGVRGYVPMNLLVRLVGASGRTTDESQEKRSEEV